MNTNDQLLHSGKTLNSEDEASVAKVDESKDNNSEGSRNTDNGQHLLLTQPFIPTFSEQMDTLPIFSNLDMDENHMNSLLPKNASEPLYAFANDFILTVNHDVYNENIGTNLPVWTSSSHTAVSDAYSPSEASSSLKMDRSETDPFMGYTYDSI